MEQNKENITEVSRPTTEHFAMEILKHEQDKSKAKNIGVIGLTVGLISVSIATVVITVYLSNINYQNDRGWRELFSSYDYVSQDGEGQNYYNNGIGGNVNNGSEGKKAEEQE